MTDGIMLQISDDGKATLYESTYDITIHCDSEKEQHEVIERLNSMNWIPVSERLPDKSGKYLATAFEGTVKTTTVVLFQSRTRLWSLTGQRAYWKVIAWMPLPEAYREEGDS